MLQDHYLPEDWGEMTDELERLHKLSMLILKRATTADFFDKKIILDQIAEAYNTLEILNKKKLLQDQHDPHGEYVRRNFF